MSISALILLFFEIVGTVALYSFGFMALLLLMLLVLKTTNKF